MMRWIGAFGLCLLLAIPSVASAQNWGRVAGRVTEHASDAPLPGVTVLVQGTDYGTATNDDGHYSLRLPEGRYQLRFSTVGYAAKTDSVVIRRDQTAELNVTLQSTVLEMDELTVEEASPTQEISVYEIKPEDVQNIPSPFKDGFRALKVLPGVATNNELTQQYSVRGGGYNENLIFINGFQVHMPFRPRQGEQEGLGLLNPDLAENITFYAGGFPAKYGGKLSSALDVRYAEPEGTIGGEASLSMLDASLNAGASALDGRFSWNLGVRKMRANRFFATQETKGDYDPDFTDVQGNFSFELAEGHELEALGIWADHEFRLEPSNRKTYFGAITQDPAIPSDLQSIWTNFTGEQRDGYTTQFGGVRLNNEWSPRFRIKHDIAYFGTKETESRNIVGESQLFDVNPGGSRSGEGHIGIGLTDQEEYADNKVVVNTLTGSGQYNLLLDRHSLEAGWTVRNLHFDDDIDESTTMDVTLQRDDGSTYVKHVRADSLTDQATMDASQAGFYIQDAFDVLSHGERSLTVTGGLRTDYYSFNGEWTVSPRLSARYTHSRRLTLSGSWGVFHQKPTYRELRGKPDPGESILDALNRDLKSQQSMQFILGGEYFFPKRRIYLRAEAYYKDLNNLVSYDIDNIRVEYSGENDAYGYTYGLDLQLRGEFVPGLDSWFNYSYMVAKENIKPEFEDKFTEGWMPRPTDQRHTFSAFIQDYVPGDKTWKLHMRLLYGSGLPYTPPVRGENSGPEGAVMVPGPRNAGRLTAYRRVDMGATKEITVLEDGLSSPVTLNLTLEVLNIFDMTNTVAYKWVPDGQNNWTRIPKHLTPRTLNARVRLQF